CCRSASAARRSGAPAAPRVCRGSAESLGLGGSLLPPLAGGGVFRAGPLLGRALNRWARAPSVAFIGAASAVLSTPIARLRGELRHSPAIRFATRSRGQRVTDVENVRHFEAF